MAPYYSNTAWTNWCSDTSTSDTAVWTTWCSNTTSYTTDTSTAWTAWQVGLDYDVSNTPVYYYTAPKMTLEQKNQLEINKQWGQVLSEWNKELAEMAEVTAQELLLELIGQEELATYKETGRVLVKGRKHDYLLTKSHKSIKVQRIEKDKIVDLCVHLQNHWDMPVTDSVIGLGLAIKANEKQFNKTANRVSSKPRTALLKAANM